MSHRGTQPQVESSEPSLPPKPVLLVAGHRYSFELASLLPGWLPAYVPEEELGRTQLSVHCSNQQCGAGKVNEVSALVQLDDHGPKPATFPRALSSLLPEDQEIAPGRHLLSAFLTLGREIYFDSHVFHTAPNGSSVAVHSAAASTPADGCRLVRPLSTVNGEKALQLELLASFEFDRVKAESDSGPRSIYYEVRKNDLLAHGEFPVGTAAVFPNAPSGDLEIHYECRLAGQVAAAGQRIVTLNPELGQPSSP